MDVEVVFRLLVAAFCVVAPSALFVGLVRGLDKLRDDRLVEQVLERLDDDDPTAPTYRRAPFTATASDGGTTEDRSADDEPPDATTPAAAVGCAVCGAPNPDYASYCQTCLSALDGS